MVNLNLKAKILADHRVATGTSRLRKTMAGTLTTLGVKANHTPFKPAYAHGSDSDIATGHAQEIRQAAASPSSQCRPVQAEGPLGTIRLRVVRSLSVHLP